MIPDSPTNKRSLRDLFRCFSAQSSSERETLLNPDSSPNKRSSVRCHIIQSRSGNAVSDHSCPGRQGRQMVPSNSENDDVIERFFSWSETALCTHPTGALPFSKDDDGKPDDDILDYVFNNVESVTCGPSSRFSES
mmetsp:Transcript_61012/g.70155  ORF Transcript_61012/g.70155 Transcript_61012/m.70155 type:complete len:136 (-) Transcript_61012:63-470(-)